ncbi:MAG TPA: ABC transporter permease [Gemmatimonadaceae bacterium]|nr:ABC transporter permease [Gemmatimonadaceae bacterium]
MADWFLDAIADARIGIRSYRRQPRFTIVALLTLALGIGGTTAMFSVVNAVLLRPPPVRAPERLVLVRESHASDVRINPAASYPDYQDLRSRHDLFASVEGYDGTNVTVSDAGAAEMVRGARITWGFFDMLGVRPARGRSFTVDDDIPGGTNAVIVTDRFWRRHFGAAPDVVGRAMTINGVRHVVRAVLPQGFYLAPAGDAELWLPIDRSAETRTQRFNRWLNIVARLRDGVTLEGARSRTADVMRALEAQYPETNTGRSAVVTSLHEDARAEIGRPVAVLFGAVALVLLIACANVASLTVARSLERAREIAIRGAIGASRGRIVRQLLVEHVVLALAGGALGAWLASALIPILLAKIPDAMFDRAPALRVVSVDLTAFAFAAGTAVLTAVAFGLAPALVASGRSANETLRSGGRTGIGRAQHRLRDSIVTAEIGMTFVILVAAVLMGRSVAALLGLDAGFTAEHVATVRVALSGPTYESGQRQQRFFENALERVRALPGVEAAGAISQPPLGGSGANWFRVDGEPVPAPGERPEATLRAVAGDYFRTLRTPILHGRPLTARDDTTSAYAMVINASLARRLFGSAASALGRRLRVYGWQDSAWTIVGVAGDVRTGGLDKPVSPTIYYSHLQGPANRMTVLARITGDRQAIAALQRTISDVDPGAAVYGGGTMGDLVQRSPAVSSRRSVMVVFTTFALTALGLALVGVYGVLTHGVSQRSREIAIRSALGATHADVIALVVRDAVRLAIAGIALGSAAALAITRSLSALLYGVTSADAVTYGLVALVLAVVSVTVSWLPARRAARVDPALALRAD